MFPPRCPLLIVSVGETFRFPHTPFKSLIDQRELADERFDQLYREVILDHYKNPRSYGLLEPADAPRRTGQNPLCGDEISVSVRFAADGETIEEIGFEGRGCAISQAATSMLTELVVRANGG